MKLNNQKKKTKQKTPKFQNLGKKRRKSSVLRARKTLLRPVRSIKGKVDKFDFITTINFCSAKDPVKRMKVQAIE